jgi:hypothetical protein
MGTAPAMTDHRCAGGRVGQTTEPTWVGGLIYNI